MIKLKKIIHPSLKSIDGNIFERVSARGVIMQDNKVLLMYTERYNDYTFPGGGVDLEEDLHIGLKRELLEETGAVGVNILENIGYIEDYRPFYKKEYDLIHEMSHFFICTADDFQEVQLEDYEIRNGMKHLWIDLDEAISHNRNIIEQKEDSLGLSIVRETTAMEIIKEYLKK